MQRDVKMGKTVTSLRAQHRANANLQLMKELICKNVIHLIFITLYIDIFLPLYIIVFNYIYFFQVLCNDGAGCDEGEDCYVPDGESKGECKRIHVEPGNKLFL